jgi:hypothetical protein
MSKLKLEFEGWHCLPKKETKVLLSLARAQFSNANFIDKCGILVETENELEGFKFCLETIEKYKQFLGSWDGYTVRKISKRIVFNYQDKKRKLSFEYFKKLVLENKFEDVKVVLAGTLYLDPDEVKVMLSTIERDLSKLFSEMNEDLLKTAYNLLIKYSSTTVRKFSLNSNQD